MRYENAKAIVRKHLNYVSGALMSAEDDLNRPAEYRTEHILNLLYLLERNIGDELYQLQRQEELKEIEKLDKMAADMEGEE